MDVVNSTTRAVYAEFLVGRARDAFGEVRAKLKPFDLLYNGVRIEAKAYAYV